MPLSFACPGCKAQIEVGDELAGLTGQCPRCQRLLIVPTPQQPQPILLDENGMPVSQPVPVAAPVPKALWRDPEPRSRSERDAPRRRVRPAPKEPSGPMWPWALGIFGAIVVGGLLFASFLVLVFWRPKSNAPRPVEVQQKRVEFKPMVERQRAQLQNGVFQARSALTNDDMFDRRGHRCKVYEVELRADVDYVLDMKSAQFDAEIRLESFDGRMLDNRQNLPGHLQASMGFRPLQTEIFVVHATSVNPGTIGEFTLTIRELDKVAP